MPPAFLVTALLAAAAPARPAPATPYVPVRSGEAWIAMRAGVLSVRGTRGPWFVQRLDGRGSTPGVGFELDANGRGRLNLTDEGRPTTPEDRWHVVFGDSAPLDLHVRLVTAKGRLDLRQIDLASLELVQGDGDVNLYLGGVRWRNARIDVQGGRGNLDLRVDGAFGVRVIVAAGPGRVDLRGFGWDGEAYVNDAYGRAPATYTIVLRVGEGRVRVSLL